MSDCLRWSGQLGTISWVYTKKKQRKENDRKKTHKICRKKNPNFLYRLRSKDARLWKKRNQWAKAFPHLSYTPGQFQASVKGRRAKALLRWGSSWEVEEARQIAQEERSVQGTWGVQPVLLDCLADICTQTLQEPGKNHGKWHAGQYLEATRGWE